MAATQTNNQRSIERTHLSENNASSDEVSRELIEGLQRTHKFINPKFFYDAHGSTLFEQITTLPEYYPTRTELALLSMHNNEIADCIGQKQVLIEPGAGSCSKVRRLLPSLQPRCFIPIDISAEFLTSSANQLQQTFPNVDVRPIAGDMSCNYDMPDKYKFLRKTVFYPGSTIGNYEPEEALEFLKHVHGQVGSNGGLLIGVDLQKDRDVLHQAYNDTQGVTALFNINILNHCNQLIDTNFDVSCFEHVAFYNAQACRIEMHLESLADQTVNVGDEIVFIAEGERIHTEHSYKYTLETFTRMAEDAGFKAVKHWVDGAGLFSLQYFTAI